MSTIKKKYTIHEARVIEEGEKRGWDVEKTWQTRMIVREEMEEKVGELSALCLGKGLL